MAMSSAGGQQARSSMAMGGAGGSLYQNAAMAAAAASHGNEQVFGKRWVGQAIIPTNKTAQRNSAARDFTE